MCTLSARFSMRFLAGNGPSAFTRLIQSFGWLVKDRNNVSNTSSALILWRKWSETAGAMYKARDQDLAELLTFFNSKMFLLKFPARESVFLSQKKWISSVARLTHFPLNDILSSDSKDRRAPIFSFGWWTCFYCLTFCKFSKFLANQSFLCSGYDVFLQRKEREKRAHVMDSEWLKAKRIIANIILVVWPFKHAHNLYHLWTVFRPRFHYTPDIWWRETRPK